MASHTVLKTFTERHPLVGPIIWILCLQYFAAQIVVAAAWRPAYSWTINPISDLGNTACGAYAGRLVCSPLHELMNASFIMLGITMAVGSLLIYQGFQKSRASLVGFGCMAAAGLGTILVGLFPENSVAALHTIGAALPFLIGNIGLIILARTLAIPKPLRLYTFWSGVISLIALLLFVTHTYLGLGQGGMERIVAYPQTFWLIIFGMYVSNDHIQKRRHRT